MRIIAGEHRGRKLLSPQGPQTRPVTDRVKQIVFDILAPRLDDASVYDVFAGTGSFGLESLSRGASHAVFFESHRPTAKLLQQNIELIRAAATSTLVAGDLMLPATLRPDLPSASLIFFDPPYRYLGEKPRELRALCERLLGKLCPGGLLVFRHDQSDTLALPGVEVDRREIGSMLVRFIAVEPR